MGDHLKSNLIVNYFPASVTDDEFREMFAAHGTMTNSKIIRDRSSGISLGYGFVKFNTDEMAAAAVKALNGKDWGSKKMKVAIARPEGQAPQGNSDLYGCNFDIMLSEDEISKIFQEHGAVNDITIFKDGSGNSRGVVHARMATVIDAKKAIEGLHGTIRPGAKNPLIVKEWTSKSKMTEEQSLQKQMGQMGDRNIPPYPSPYGPPMGGPPSSGGFGGYGPARGRGGRYDEPPPRGGYGSPYGPPRGASYGRGPYDEEEDRRYSAPPPASTRFYDPSGQPVDPPRAPSGSRGGGRDTPFSSGGFEGYGGDPYAARDPYAAAPRDPYAAPRDHAPDPYGAGSDYYDMGHGGAPRYPPYGGGGGAYGGSSGYGAPGGGSGGYGAGAGAGGGSGGPKSTLFVFHLPKTMSNVQLQELFEPCATQGKILKTTVIEKDGISRGFGFVDFESPADANNAVETMNGHSIEGKFLKVSFKT
jgi:CUG-BP- and ETR3-like factor